MSTVLEATKPSHTVVGPQQWLAARKELLAKEKQCTHLHDELAELRRRLPWVKVEKPYSFETPCGTHPLSDLFGDKSQLLIYHFMFGPDWKEGCPSCSLVADHLNASAPHIRQRDVSLMLVSRAPLEKLQAFKTRMGWDNLFWASSFGSDFNYDFHASFAPEQKKDGKVDYNYTVQPFPSDEAPGASVFFKDPSTGEIFHTYSTYGRGLDALVGAYTLLDMVPKGRDEDHLGFPMEWVRHHDRYAGGEFADADKPYWPKVAPAAPAPSATGKSPCGCH